ncbi:MAG: DUF1801 domain-containing protein [Planctomycetes bacterium]|nr:DUF1801 domain-containing protein [Planctomycetota bacterium]
MNAVSDYIAAAAPAVRPVLRELRRVVRAAAPDAEEVISYGMPTLRMHGVLVHYAAFREHVGLFPPVRGDARLDAALAPFRGPKGNLKFPLDRPIPFALIARIVKLRVKQDREAAAAKVARKSVAKKTAKKKPR